jgi:diacylglycerol kinase
VKRPTYSHELLSSFVYATKGWLLGLRQRNMRIHLAMALIVIGCGFAFHLTHTEWMMVSIAIALVLTAELFNTALEKLADEVTKEYSAGIGQAKDMASGAVLSVAVLSIVIGIFVFGPRLALLLFGL